MLEPREVSSLKYLPQAVLATTLVVIGPVLLSLAFDDLGDGALSTAGVAALSCCVSVLLGRATAVVWNRRAGRELEFGELMLWNWLRLSRAERRLVKSAELLGLDEHGNRLTESPLPPDQRRRVLLELNSALEAKDPYTVGHARRVAGHAYWIAVKMGLPVDEVKAVRAAAEIHDVGKIHVPDEVLRKPGGLTADEYEVMKHHSAVGAEMVAALGDERITSIVRSHHERWDGEGYPDGIKGSDIPVGARIIAVADAYDAITTNRSYRARSSHAKAVDILRVAAGKQFDPMAVEAFLSRSPQKATRWVAILTAAPWRVAWTREGMTFGSASLAQAGAAATMVAIVGATMVVPAAPQPKPVTRRPRIAEAHVMRADPDASVEQTGSAVTAGRYGGSRIGGEPRGSRDQSGERAKRGSRRPPRKRAKGPHPGERASGPEGAAQSSSGTIVPAAKPEKATPMKPGKPAKPAKPAKQAKPAKPAAPEEPEEPGPAAKPDKTINPGNSPGAPGDLKPPKVPNDPEGSG